MAPVDDWKPCEVLHGDRWCRGYVERWRRDDRGWRALVRYTASPGMSYIHWRPQDEVRPLPQPQAVLVPDLRQPVERDPL